MNRPALTVDGVLLPRLALAGRGFRPFFLCASVFGALIVPQWLLVLGGVLEPRTYLEPVAWHAHEMVFGYAVAVIAGFLLTAVANWTQRETLRGAPLLVLAALWVMGRVVMSVPAALPRGAVALIDVAFLPALAVVLARPLVQARNRRNFVMLVILGLLTAANIAVHLEALGVVAAGLARHACLIGVDVVVVLMLIIGGRIIPMFTRNTTNITTITSNPHLERLTVIAALALVAVDVVRPGSQTAEIAAGLLAVTSLARAARWGTRHTAGHPLLWILHVGYAWIPVGLLLRALSTPGALHALTVGAIGTLTIGMMARVTLGHTGRPLIASPITIASFVAITVAAIARVFLPMMTPVSLAALVVAGTLWTLAFVLFLATYGAALLSPRADGKAG